VNRVFKALADPTRRRVLQLLREAPMSAGELSDHFPVSKPTMSAHFSVLQEADLIEAEKVGRTILYRLKMSVLEDALLAFAQTLGWQMKPEVTTPSTPSRKSKPRTARRAVEGDV
jgi:ArsR family transcriptional regulator, repressor of sdpIR and other operons